MPSNLKATLAEAKQAQPQNPSPSYHLVLGSQVPLITPTVGKLKKAPTQKFTIVSRGTDIETFKFILAASLISSAIIICFSTRSLGFYDLVAWFVIWVMLLLGGICSIMCYKFSLLLFKRIVEKYGRYFGLFPDIIKSKEDEQKSTFESLAKKMIEFAQYGKIADFEGLEEDLYKISHKLSIDDLMKLSLHQIIQSTTKANALDRMKMAMVYDLRELALACVQQASNGY